VRGKTLIFYLKTHSNEFMGQLPILCFTKMGLLGFIFNFGEDANNILCRQWYWVVGDMAITED